MSSNCESILVLRTEKQELMTPPLPDTCMITINLCFNVMLDVVLGGARDGGSSSFAFV